MIIGVYTKKNKKKEMDNFYSLKAKSLRDSCPQHVGFVPAHMEAWEHEGSLLPLGSHDLFS